MFNWFKKAPSKSTLESELLEKIIGDTEEKRIDWVDSESDFSCWLATVNGVCIEVDTSRDMVSFYDQQGGRHCLKSGKKVAYLIKLIKQIREPVVIKNNSRISNLTKLAKHYGVIYEDDR